MPTPIDPDDEITQPIPLITMAELVFGEGHAPIGPSRPTRDLRPVELETSDGVPTAIEDSAAENTQPHVRSAA